MVLFQVHRGVKGVVQDSHNMLPIYNATINVEGIPHPVRTSKFGDYWRLLIPDEYTITVEHPDYEPATKKVVVVKNGGEATELNFVLKRLKRKGDEDFEDDVGNGTATGESLDAVAKKAGSFVNQCNVLLQGMQFLHHQTAFDIFRIGNVTSEEAYKKARILLIGYRNGDDETPTVASTILLGLLNDFCRRIVDQDKEIGRILQRSTLYVAPMFPRVGQKDVDAVAQLVDWMKKTESVDAVLVVQDNGDGFRYVSGMGGGG